MLASNFNITLDRAADYLQVLTCYTLTDEPVTVFANEFFGQVREVASKKKVVDFTFETPTPESGEVRLIIPNESTKLLRSSVKYEYDIFKVTGPTTLRLIFGSLTVHANTTRNANI